MIESIIRRYNLYSLEEEQEYKRDEAFRQTSADTISFLMTKIENFKPDSGYKAYSYCGGMAGMDSVLLAAGAPGKRFALPYSRVMIHQPLGGAQGQATEIEIHAREILRIRQENNASVSRGLLKISILTAFEYDILYLLFVNFLPFFLIFLERNQRRN